MLMLLLLRRRMLRRRRVQRRRRGAASPQLGPPLAQPALLAQQHGAEVARAAVDRIGLRAGEERAVREGGGEAGEGGAGGRV